MYSIGYTPLPPNSNWAIFLPKIFIANVWFEESDRQTDQRTDRRTNIVALCLQTIVVPMENWLIATLTTLAKRLLGGLGQKATPPAKVIRKTQQTIQTQRSLRKKGE